MKPIYMFKFAVICSLSLFANISNAQMVGSNVFLKGRYVEVGMTSNGAYGASTSPSVYHSHCGYTGATPSGPLGFVADPAMDGWTVGTPAYVGDYFYPGSPFEGWTLQVNGRRCQGYNTSTGAYNYSGGMPTITGTSISYAASGTKVIGTWQGTIDSIVVTQTTTLDTNNLYFTVKMLFTNTAVLPRNNIYYMRSVDADNDITWPGGNFATNNLVEYQSTDTTIVSATGISSPLTYMAFGTADTAATALIYGAWGMTVAQDLAPVYNGTYSGSSVYYAPGVVHFGDIAIGLVMNIPHLATVDSAGDSVFRTTATPTLHPANTASFTYYYAFSHAAVDSAITHLNGGTVVTPPGALGIKNINNASDIKVYPNPSKDLINITGLYSGDRLSLYDMMGRAVIQNYPVYQDGKTSLQLGNLPAGAYILVVQDAAGNMKTRIPVRVQ